MEKWRKQSQAQVKWALTINNPFFSWDGGRASHTVFSCLRICHRNTEWSTVNSNIIIIAQWPNSRFFTIFLLHCELSPTCTLKQPRCNHVQITSGVLTVFAHHWFANQSDGGRIIPSSLFARLANQYFGINEQSVTNKSFRNKRLSGRLRYEP